MKVKVSFTIDTDAKRVSEVMSSVRLAQLAQFLKIAKIESFSIEAAKVE